MTLKRNLHDMGVNKATIPFGHSRKQNGGFHRCDLTHLQFELQHNICCFGVDCYIFGQVRGAHKLVFLSSVFLVENPLESKQ